MDSITLQTFNRVWSVVYSDIQIHSFQELQDIDAEYIENKYDEILDERDPSLTCGMSLPYPDEVPWEVYNGVAEDLRDVLHSALADTLGESRAWGSDDWDD